VVISYIFSLCRRLSAVLSGVDLAKSEAFVKADAFLAVLRTSQQGGYESIMQNKANLLDTQMNVSSVKTKNYENKRLCRRGEKQTQSNPISYSNKTNTTFLLTKDYE
jgi:hypothetical protein